MLLFRFADFTQKHAFVFSILLGFRLFNNHRMNAVPGARRDRIFLPTAKCGPTSGIVLVDQLLTPDGISHPGHTLGDRALRDDAPNRRRVEQVPMLKRQLELGVDGQRLTDDAQSLLAVAAVKPSKNLFMAGDWS